MQRNQREEDLRENHPFFDTPLLIVPRECKFRKMCQKIVRARYNARLKDSVTGEERKIQYESLHNDLGLIPYLDWVMILITTISSISMLFETPQLRVMDQPIHLFAEYAFVIFMSLEMSLKILADGFFLKDVAFTFDVFVYIVSATFLCFQSWMPIKVEPDSPAGFLMILRCFRLYRIIRLIPCLRRAYLSFLLFHMILLVWILFHVLFL